MKIRKVQDILFFFAFFAVQQEFSQCTVHLKYVDRWRSLPQADEETNGNQSKRTKKRAQACDVLLQVLKLTKISI